MGDRDPVTDPSGCRSMTWRPRARPQRRILAVVLAAVGVGMVIVEPFPKGVVLFSLTETHGVDTGDLPALALLLVAAWLAV
jgi:hypothetical protein